MTDEIFVSEKKGKRKIIQISIAADQGSTLIALCDDSTLWINEKPYRGKDSEWHQIKDVPQPSEA